ncbi:MAG: hypothetical protein AABM64_06645 [Pseudomonadota bacterium]
MSVRDLSRWNRAGLNRLRYVDGNAVTYLDELLFALRGKLKANFPPGTGWLKELDKAEQLGETKTETQQRLADQYAAARRGIAGVDWGVELARELARATHVLTEYLDVYANEATLRTATQWDNVRRLVEMLDYHPAPPASAATTLVILAKPGKRGRVAKGFAAKHVPAEGGAPVVFETLADLEIDAELNELRHEGHDRSPEKISGLTLKLAERVPGLRLGEPVVLERSSERLGEPPFTLARIVAGISEENARTVLAFDEAIGEAAGFTYGDTLVHVKPADRLAPLGPMQTDVTAAMLRTTLVLKEEPRTLGENEVVYIADGRDAYFRQARAIQGKRVTLDRPLVESGGQPDGLRLDQAYISRARRVAVARVGGRKIKSRSGTLFSFKAAGDLSAAATPPLIADFVMVDGTPQLTQFKVITAKYQPPVPDDPTSGYTTFTVEDSGRRLSNPQAVYLPAVSREWKLDSFLFHASGGLVPHTIDTTPPKSTIAGDLAVIVSGRQLAWTRLAGVASDPDAGRAALTAQQQWHRRASGRFYLSETRIYGHFTKQVRPNGWDQNTDEVSGPALQLAAPRPELLVVGRKLWIEQREGDARLQGREAVVIDLPKGGGILIDPPLEAEPSFTKGNTVICGNVETAGHGETQNERILGSGNAAALNQSFVLAVAGVSFVADRTLPAGVRADIDVRVDGQRWQQVSTLDDSGPGDTHYVVRMTEAGFVRIDFGDGKNGRRLPTGVNNVRSQHRLGTGLGGNLPAGRLEKPARPHPLVDKLRHPLAASGGGDMEGVASLKRNAPASTLTLERAVSAEDYGHLAAAHAAVWRARAFARPAALKSARIEVVVVPAGGANLDDRLRATLETFLATHSQPGVEVMVSGFGRVWLHLKLVLRVVSAQYDPKLVKEQAAARLMEAFALERRDIGAPLYLSDVYAVVEAIPGVSNSSCRISHERPPPGGEAPAPGNPVHEAGQRIIPAPHEVVFLEPQKRPGSLQIEAEEFEL